MSVEFTVYLSRSEMPSPKEWATGIVDAGFGVELDTKFDVDAFSGFLPCKLDGVDSGFEYGSGPIEIVDGLELPEDFDFSVTFTTHSDMRELATSVVSAGVLCSLTGGVLVDLQADEAVAGADAIEWARETLDEIDLDE
jgi:hypothetical protein